MELESINIEAAGQFQQQHFLQSSFWASFKEKHNWKALRFSSNNPEYFECSVLIRSFFIPILGEISLAYIPMGIDLKETSKIKNNFNDYSNLVKDFSKSLKKNLPTKTICIRFDLPVDLYTLEDRKIYITNLKKMGFKKIKDNIQPPDTVLLNLSLSEEELLEKMKSKWRYNIRLAQKKGVEIHQGSSNDIDIFYDLYKTTAIRDGIAIHSKDYYKDLLIKSETCNNDCNPKISLYIATYENKPLAAIITLFSPRESVYLYGASSNENRNLMPAYLLQWTAICDAKKYGSKYYDFYGMPPTDDEKHPMHGLYRFKTGFGGTIVHRPGTIDIPLSFLYYIYAFAEKIRNFWFKKIKKLLRKK